MINVWKRKILNIMGSSSIDDYAFYYIKILQYNVESSQSLPISLIHITDNLGGVILMKASTGF
jgi:hypothetical protein